MSWMEELEYMIYDFHQFITHSFPCFGDENFALACNWQHTVSDSCMYLKLACMCFKINIFLYVS